MYLSKYGEIVQNWWDEIPIHFLNVESGPFVIMPNHVHGIIFIIDKRRGGETQSLYKPTLGQIIAYFKYQASKEMNQIETRDTITRFWQRKYYEHIIRNEKELQQKTNYILDNPARWNNDQENPRNIKTPDSL